MKRAFIGLLIIIIIGGGGYYFYWLYIHEPSAQYVPTDDPELKKVRSNLKAIKTRLNREGKYDCCIHNACNWCALYMGHCSCQHLVKQKGNEKSCPECAAAWNRKQGNIPGIDPKAIEVTTFGIYGYEKEGHHYSTEPKNKSNNDQPATEKSEERHIHSH